MRIPYSYYKQPSYTTESTHVGMGGARGTLAPPIFRHKVPIFCHKAPLDFWMFIPSLLSTDRLVSGRQCKYCTTSISAPGLDYIDIWGPLPLEKRSKTLMGIANTSIIWWRQKRCSETWVYINPLRLSFTLLTEQPGPGFLSTSCCLN